jgi:nitrogen fixation protein NifQ
MSAAIQPQQNREQIYARMTSGQVLSPSRDWLACIVASWCNGQGVLPDYLGLDAGQFNALNQYFFPDYSIPGQAPSGSQLDFSRMLEKDDLVNLLKLSCKPNVLEMDWIIGIIVAACLGGDHLWQDLGLWSRPQLTAMMHCYFPKLAAKNDQDMKWKKFLYKQLCIAEGVTLCLAPSCEVCIDYPKCFSPED